jgi:hypothetical protein
MFQVTDVYDEAKASSGFCDEPKLFRWITDAIQLIGNKSDFDGWLGFVDICVDGQCVTLPREVENVLGVNIGGTPTLGRNQLFNFHLNGPGDCNESIAYSYQDKGWHPVYKDIVDPVKLIAFVDKQSDAGTELRVYGYDENGHPVRQFVGGQWQDGYLIPTVYGLAVADADMPKFSRITRVRKGLSDGVIRLSTLDDAGTSGIFLGVYEPDEVEPYYRRIKLGKTATWVRLAYRKAAPTINSKYDRIPLKSRRALLLAMQALKYYNEVDLANATAFEVHATRLESEANEVAESPTMTPLQVVDFNNLQDKCDRDIV